MNFGPIGHSANHSSGPTCIARVSRSLRKNTATLTINSHLVMRGTGGIRETLARKHRSVPAFEPEASVETPPGAKAERRDVWCRSPESNRDALSGGRF